MRNINRMNQLLEQYISNVSLEQILDINFANRYNINSYVIEQIKLELTNKTAENLSGVEYEELNTYILNNTPFRNIENMIKRAKELYIAKNL